MSTEHLVFERDGLHVILDERANEFTLLLKAADEDDRSHIATWGDGVSHVPTACAYVKGDFTVEEVVQMALRMIHAAGCQVYDGQAFIEKVTARVAEIRI